MADTKKTLYHSELSKLGKIEVVVKTDVMKSKFKSKTGEDQFYVILELDGNERSYNCENDACKEFFESIPKGTTLTIEADGSREDATIESDYDGPRADEQAPQAPPARPAAPDGKKLAPPTKPTGKTPAVAPTAATASFRIAQIQLISYARARAVREQIQQQFEEGITPDHFQAICSTIAIQLEREGYHHQMPTDKWLDVRPGAK